jgi:predicted homoserine dehydrogenase-like protein
MKRRNFLKNSSLAAASVAFMPSTQLFAKSASANAVKIGIIGVGLRGQGHLDLLLRRKDVEVVAICDISDYMLQSAKDDITKSGKKMPAIYLSLIHI